MLPVYRDRQIMSLKIHESLSPSVRRPWCGVSEVYVKNQVRKSGREERRAGRNADLSTPHAAHCAAYFAQDDIALMMRT